MSIRRSLGGIVETCCVSGSREHMLPLLNCCAIIFALVVIAVVPALGVGAAVALIRAAWDRLHTCNKQVAFPAFVYSV
jgi:hypothetical protein